MKIKESAAIILIFSIIAFSGIVLAQYYYGGGTTGNSVSSNSQNYMIVIGDNSQSIDSHSATKIKDNLISKGNTASIVTDSSFSDDGTSDVISVGGSCVNRVSANWLNLNYPSCGLRFSSKTDVVSGQYLFRTFSMTGGRIGILVAGYEGDDTMNDVNYLLGQSIGSLGSDVIHIGGSATSGGGSTGGTGGTGGAQTHSVSINNFAFSPASLTINKGDTVVWTNMQSGTPHTVTSDSGSELGSGQLSTGSSYSHTFNTAGTFAYHCSIHPTMHGTVIVQ